MTITREYRVVLPLSVEEFQRGREWHHVEKLKMDLKQLRDHDQAHGDCTCSNMYNEDVSLKEMVKEMPFFHGQKDMPKLEAEHVIKHYGETPKSVGIFSRFYHALISTLDVFATNLIQVSEVESWDAYPYFSSLSTNRYLGNSFGTIIEGRCLPGNCTDNNALKLPADVLKRREVVLVDIAGDVDLDDYRDGKDPLLFRSNKTGRGPLKPHVWFDEVNPCMTCYVLVSIKCDFLGIGLTGILERKLQKGIERAMLLHHRELYCLMDDWIDSPLDEIRAEEENTISKLKSYNSKGEDDQNENVNRNDATKKQEIKAQDQPASAAVPPPQVLLLEESFLRKYTPLIASCCALLVAIIIGISPSAH